MRSWGTWPCPLCAGTGLITFFTVLGHSGDLLRPIVAVLGRRGSACPDTSMPIV